jgi:predicted DNA-binding transcriptional regulator AlpA
MSKTDRFIPPSQIANKLNVHPSSVPRIFARDADAPKPVRIGCRNKYKESEVDSYLRARGIA